jgi:hypothetical protein
MDVLLPDPITVQPELPDVHILDSASNLEARLTAIKGSLAKIEAALLHLLYKSQNPTPPAPAPAALAPAEGPDFTILTPGAKSVL